MIQEIMMMKRMKTIEDEKSLYKLQIPVVGMINASDSNKLKHINTIIISRVRSEYFWQLDVLNMERIFLVARCPEYGAKFLVVRCSENGVTSLEGTKFGCIMFWRNKRLTRNRVTLIRGEVAAKHRLQIQFTRTVQRRIKFVSYI